METIGKRLNRIRNEIGLPQADIMTNIEPIGKRLKRLRLEMGISQLKVAELMSVRRETIGHWERLDNSPQNICKSKLEEILNNWDKLIGFSDKL